MENDVLINVIILSDVIEHVVNHVHLVRTVQTALVLVNAVYIADVTRQMAVVIVQDQDGLEYFVINHVLKDTMV